VLAEQLIAPAEAGAIERSLRDSCSVTLAGERGSQLALVHLRAPFDAETLGLPVELFLCPFVTHRHETTPFRLQTLFALPGAEIHKRSLLMQSLVTEMPTRQTLVIRLGG